MSSYKYSRLKSRDPDGHKYKFNALDGPSYFTYDVPPSKYHSAFTYNNKPSSESDSRAAYKLMVHGQLNSSEHPENQFRPSLLSRILTVLASTACYLLLVMTLPVSICLMLKLTQTFERIVIFRLGRLLDVKGPGYVLVLPCIDRWVKVDLRQKAFSVPPQKAITADGATIEIGADVYFRVKDALLSVANIQDLNHSTRILCQTSLQKHIGKKNLSDIETDHDGITEVLLTDVNEMAQSWGVEVGKIQLSAVKVHSQPDPSFNQANNVIKCLSSVLFPAGTSNAPIEQLQQFYQFTDRSAATTTTTTVGTDAMVTFTDPNAISGARMTCVEDLMCRVQSVLCRSLVNEFGCIYKFVIRDGNSPGSTIYHLDLKDGEGHAGVGEPPGGAAAADVTLSLTSAVLHDLLLGQVSAFNAYMGGQLAVVGDLRAAMRLGELFKTLNAAAVANPSSS